MATGRASRVSLTILLLAGSWPVLPQVARTPVALLAQQCTFTPGYWRNHAAEWPTQTLVLGDVSYSGHTYQLKELLSLLDAPTRSDASLVLATQLIAAKLNVANGANPAPIKEALTRADTLLGAFRRRLPYGVKSNSPTGSDMTATAKTLEDFNRGLIPGSCGPVNTPPIADAGRDQTVAVGQLATLDGSASSDADGHALTFTWAMASKPSASAAVLSDVTAVKPTFTADVPGAYDLQLIVHDGFVASTPATVRVSTMNSRPVADAGPDQTTVVGATAALDGGGSSDPDGDPLTFMWSLTSAPAGSSATLDNPTAVAPSLVIDRPGHYTIELVVSDGALSSAADFIIVSTINSAPGADAGPNTTGRHGDTITLDGSGSIDVDGDSLNYRWTLVTRPAGSAAALLNDTAVNPSFVIDVSGDYVAQLIVNDGTVDSTPDTVTVTTLNTQPQANAGPDQAVVTGQIVQLDGSGSTDVDGNPLSYDWSLTTIPAGSAAALSDTAAVQPTFTPDVSGTYVAQLIVRDLTSASDPDTVSVVVQAAPPTNLPPTAEAGVPQTVTPGATVTLDGSGSSDPDGDPLIYKWSLSRPAGSTAALSDANAANPTFVADQPGVYVAQLIVNDGTVDSAADTVSISTVNSVPVADAGVDRAVATGTTVPLDGSTSFDPDGTPLVYSWSLTRPAGSSATLSDPSIVNPTFVADVDGTYVAQLIVGDGLLVSAPDTVTITAAPGADLQLSVFSVATTPPIGSTQTWGLQVHNLGPADTTGVLVSAALPAGYSFVSASAFVGSYDAATGIWTIGPAGNGTAATLFITYRVNPTGPYALTASVLESSAPDPNLANNTRTDVVTANANADLSVSFFSAVANPPIGSTQTWGMQVHNLGPADTTNVRVSAALPAGYTFVSALAFVGSYDPATGIWTIGPAGNGTAATLFITYRVNPTGPHDLTASVLESSAPDPNLANNTRTDVVTPNPNADLRVSFLNFSPGTRQPGELLTMLFDVVNDGPAEASSVIAQFRIPSGFTITAVSLQIQAGMTYDEATGIWTIGTLSAGQLARLVVSMRVNATGPIDLRAAITSSSAPDPNLANNVVIPERINRPPVANAGADRAATTNAVVTLDGSSSFDADGDPITFEWVSALRPINSAATLTGVATASPSLTPDLPGNYRAQLVVRDSFGIASAPDEVAVGVVVTNSPPGIVSAPATAAFVQQPYQYDVNAADPDAGDVLAFSLVTAPSGMTIDPGTGVIDWTPAANQAGAQSVSVRVQDAAGLFDTQTYSVQVSSPTDRAPIAVDDEYSVRVSESLSVAAPGVTGNDTDEGPLSVRLVSAPGNGTALLNADGSFTYTPNTLLPGEFVLAENVNLAARMPGVTVIGSACPRCAIDENVTTKWESAGAPIEIVFPAAVTVSQVRIVATRNPNEHKISAGIFELIDANGVELYDSGPVEILGPLFDATLNVPSLQGVRRVRFTPTASPTFLFFASLDELKVIGTGLIRRESRVEPNLVQLLPATVQSNSVSGGNTAEGLIDDAPSNWYSNGNAGAFIEVTFPLDVTVTQLVTANPNGRPDGFGSSNPIDCSGTFTVLDASRAVLFDSGLINEPSGFLSASDIFTLDLPQLAGVRHVRYTLSSCTGLFPAGFAEWRVIGTAPVTTPAFGLAKKFQALLGREAHSTPIVVNLTDDNGDGLVNADDIPDIVVPVEAIGDQLKGEIKAISGADGTELFTAGGPDLVSPWSEVAAGDIDGDGAPEIIAVHSAGNRLIAFEHTGQLKWVSDANPMPSFNLGSIVYTGAVSIANLDGAGAPEIIVGASVFDSDGRLLGDGRTLNGTAGGLGLRSAISAVADIDLDGTPELVAGPTAYRLSGGALSTVWQRTDRPDGYVAIANLDDDPHAEIVSVANGVVYVLNHDGSDYQGWNAPTNAPLPIPGGGQGGAPLIVDVDGDGRPEIGVAAAGSFVLFNRDGSVRWKGAISDRTSNSTGAVAFDLNGDGQVEIIYRDEFFLRIYRGADGVLLAKTPVGSATWAEEPVVVDVDNDGHADIIVASDLFQQPATDTGIIVLQDVANKWKRTRRIWNQHAYHVTNVNEDATIPVAESAHWVVPGLNAFRTNAFVPGESSDETDSFTYVASDGVLESNPATVRIALRTPNSPPQFTSTPVASAAAGVLYSYAAQAADPDAGDILTYSLPTEPPGMTIDAISGLIAWTPTTAQVGAHDVVVKVADLRGLYALQAFTLDVGAPLTVPDIVGAPETAARSAITNAGLTVGSVTTRHSASVAAGDVISQTPAGGSAAAAGAPVSYVVSLGPPPVGVVPDVVGQTQTSAQLDVSAAGFSPAVTGQNNAAVPAGIVFAQSPAAGTTAPQNSTVTMVVSLGPPPGELDLDLDGFTGNQGDCNDTDAAINPAAFDIPGDGIDQNCNGADSIAGDTTFPVAAIESPAEDAEITMPADIVGTATDGNFLRYRLLLAHADENGFSEIATGTTPVNSGPLGRLDPTLLENGIYRVRLVVEDVNGQLTIDERPYRVTGEAKIGVLGLSFVDLRVPVSGIAITVIRNYDSRVKTQRDLGVGWDLQVRTGKYQNNRPPGDGWRIETAPGPFGLPCTVTTEVRPHVTELRLSDREVYRFKPRLAGLAPVVGGCVGSVVFDFVAGNLPATLEVLGNADIIYTSGDRLTEFDGSADTGLLFDPRRVRLTLVDGRVLEFERGRGITRVQDPNGNALAISDAGIVHSSGKSIAFIRDSSGRITEIVDPNGASIGYAYANGDLIEYTDQTGNRTTFVYDTDHHLVEINDPLGNRALRSEYDTKGRLVAMIDAKGRRIEFTHDVSGRQESIIDARGNVSVFAYNDLGFIDRVERAVTIDGVQTLATSTFVHDALGNVLSTVDPDGQRTDSVYDGQDLTEEVIDPAGLRIRSTITLDARREPLTITDPEGNALAFAYDLRGNLRTFSDALGTPLFIGYDDAGRPTAATDANGVRRAGVYDNAGNLLSEEARDSAGTLLERRQYSYDANGNRLTSTVLRTVGVATTLLTTSFAYDARNRLVAVTDPLGHTSRIRYNALGLVEAQVDALNRETRHTYDALGARIRTDFPDGSFETVTYDESGNVIAETDRAGRTVQRAYDELNREIQVTSAAGDTSHTVYSPGGRIMAVIDEAGIRTDFEYDAAGRRIRTRLPQVLNATTGTPSRPEILQEYDANGRPTATVDPNGHRTTLQWQGSDRLTRREFADGTSVQSVYDALGRAIERIDEAGRSTRFVYDGLGRLTSVIEPAPTPQDVQPTTTYEWDEAGNLVKTTDAAGRTTTFRYDELNRPIRRTLPGGVFETFAYDTVGNLSAHTDFNGQTTTFNYDVMNRLTQKHLPGGAAVSVTYRPNGQRASATDSRGTTTYQYDSDHRLSQVTHPGGELVTYNYDARGQLARVDSPAGSSTYQYDAAGRLTRVTGPSGVTSYGLDLAGNVVTISAPNGVVTQQTFDTRHRLTNIHHARGTTTLASFAYALSPTGRRLSMTEADGSIETYSYDLLDRLNAETRIGSHPRSISYTYDLVGNRTSMLRNATPTFYTYDMDHRLLTAGATSFTYDQNGNTVSQTTAGLVTGYEWDAENRLIRATGPGGNTEFGYDVDGNRISRSVDGALTRFLVDNVVTGLAQPLEERDAAGALVAHHTYGHRRLSTTNGTASTFYQQDALGSTRLLTDGNGAVTDTYRYDAYGALVASTGSTANSYLFAGERFEPSVGLIDLRARNYSPAIGRFLGRDPAAARLNDPRSAHPFLYAHADPVNVTDPTGRYSLIEINTVQSIQNVLKGLEQCTARARQACRSVGLAQGFAQLGAFAAAAILAQFTYDVAESIATRDSAFLAIPSAGLVTGGFAMKPKPRNGFEKVEYRVFVAPPSEMDFTSGVFAAVATPPFEVKMVAAFDFVVSGQVPVKLRGSFEWFSGRAGLDAGTNAGFKLEPCPGVEIASVELAIRFGGSEALFKPRAAFRSKEGLGLEATLLKVIKFQYPLFPTRTDAGH